MDSVARVGPEDVEEDDSEGHGGSLVCEREKHNRHTDDRKGLPHVNVGDKGRDDDDAQGDEGWSGNSVEGRRRVSPNRVGREGRVVREYDGAVLS